MKLVHPLLPADIIFEENQVVVLYVENARVLSQLILELNKQESDDEGEFVLSNLGSQLSIKENLELILSPFDVNSNSKKLINALYHELDSVSTDEDNYLKLLEVKTSIIEYTQWLTNHVDYSLTINEDFSLNSILKLCDVKFSNSNEASFLESLTDYILLVNAVMKKTLFVIIGLLDYLSPEEIDAFYKTVLVKKIRVLILQGSRFIKKKRLDEKVFIIDSELCEISI